MQLFINPFQDVQKSLFLFFSLLLFANISFFCLWFLFLPNGSNLLLSSSSVHLPKARGSESVFGGPLFLRPSSFTPRMPDLSKEMSICLSVDRPDRKGAKRGEIFLLQSGEKKLFESQQRIYLSFGEKKMLKFSQNPSPLWLEMQMKEKDKVECRAGIGEEAKGRFTPFVVSFQMQPIEKPLALQKDGEVCFQKLLKAKWSGEDFRSFFQQNGLKEKKKEHRLEIDSVPLLVSESDWLSFQGDRWQKVSAGQETENYPLAMIGSIKEQQIEIDAFDREGNLEKILLNKQMIPPFKTNPEEWISSFRTHSKTSLSIAFEKQHFLFHKGNWAFRKEGRWKLLKAPALLQTLTAEAFFFFEGVEEKEGQKWMKGVFFNGNGTLKVPVEKKIVSGKKRTLGGKAPPQEELSKKEEKK